MNLPDQQVNQEGTGSQGVCGLCGAATLRDEGGTPYIVCQPCYNKFLSVSPVYKRQINELPFGVIELDSQATVLAYNRAEAELAQLQSALFLISRGSVTMPVHPRAISVQ